MSDIIDINLNKTVEVVEILVTENLTTVNVNTIVDGGSDFVKLTTDQTIDGKKTFLDPIVIPIGGVNNEAVNVGQMNTIVDSAVSGLVTSLTGKVDKVTGKSLVDNSLIAKIGNNKNTFRTITLSQLGVSTFAEVTNVIVQDYIDGLGISQLEGETLYFEVVENTILNFDVTANWETGDTNYPVTDQASFVTFLETRVYNNTNNLTNIVITNFSLVAGRLSCNLSANGTVLDMSEMGVTQCLCVGNVIGLQYLYLSENQITTLIGAVFPTGLQYLGLYSNQITTLIGAVFPTGLQYLYLSENQITTLIGAVFPTGLINLGLHYNQFTTQDYIDSEAWANDLVPFTTICEVYFSGNPDSISGTTLEAILITKNTTIYA